MKGSIVPWLTAALWALTAFAAPGVSAAAAQCRLCESPTTTVETAPGSERVELSIEANLDFDQIVLTGRGQGSATLDPDGSRFVSGTVSALSGRAMVGSVTIHGQPGRDLLINLPDRIELFAPSGSRILLDRIESDLSDSPRLDGNGELNFRFGGRILIEGDAEGDYRGDVPITVDYL